MKKIIFGLFGLVLVSNAAFAATISCTSTGDETYYVAIQGSTATISIPTGMESILHPGQPTEMVVGSYHGVSSTHDGDWLVFESSNGKFSFSADSVTATLDSGLTVTFGCK